MRMAPGPLGFSVVCRTSQKVESMYARRLRTVFVFRKNRGTFVIVSFLPGDPGLSAFAVSVIYHQIPGTLCMIWVPLLCSL